MPPQENLASKKCLARGVEETNQISYVWLVWKFHHTELVQLGEKHLEGKGHTRGRREDGLNQIVELFFKLWIQGISNGLVGWGGELRSVIS